MRSTATSIDKGCFEMSEALRFDGAQEVDCAGTKPWTMDFDERPSLSAQCGREPGVRFRDKGGWCLMNGIWAGIRLK